MKFLFWIFLILLLFFLFLTIRGKRKKGKLMLRFLVPAIVFFIPFAMLSGINILYHTLPGSQPTTSAMLVENKNFHIGHASKRQPKSLDKYVRTVAPQIGMFHKRANTFWPDSSFEDAVVYFISSDKKQAWKVNYDGTHQQIEDVKSTPQYSSIIGYETEFLFLDPNVDKEKGMVLVIDQKDLLDQVKYEEYTHVGMYDPLITYVHEGFHHFAQGDERWKTNPPKGDRSDHLDNLEARKLRTFSIQLLYQALQNEKKRDLYVKQAVQLYQKYMQSFKDEYNETQYLDKIEGTAYYYEVATCLQVCYPKQVNNKNYTDAITLWTTNKQAKDMTGSSHEAYELGVLAGTLLDIYEKDPLKWKKQIQEDPETTPMTLLAGQFTKKEIHQTKPPEISQAFTDSLVAAIDETNDTKSNLIPFLYHVFF